MKTFLKLSMLLLFASPAFFFVSCNDDDDDNNNSENKTNSLQLRELYDNEGDIMIYDYDSKDRISKLQLYDDGNYLFANIGYNPLKMIRYRLASEDTEFDEEQTFENDELGRLSDIKTDKNGNVTSCTVTKRTGTVKATIKYDNDQHPVKVIHSYNGEWNSTDVAELTWTNGNLVHYTVTDEEGLYLESIIEYGSAKNMTGQATYGLVLAYWNEIEYFTGLLGKLSKNLPTKLTTKHYDNGNLDDINVCNIYYSYGDNNDVAEEYLENKEDDFWVSHIGKHVNRYAVYHGYTK